MNQLPVLTGRISKESRNSFEIPPFRPSFSLETTGERVGEIAISHEVVGDEDLFFRLF